MDSSIGDFADFLGVESLPRLSIEVLIKWYDKEWIDKVDKGISNVAVVLQVNGKVEKVVFAAVVLVNLLQEHLLGVLVGDVSDHDGRARVFASQNSIKINLESIIITVIEFSLIIKILASCTLEGRLF